MVLDIQVDHGQLILLAAMTAVLAGIGVFAVRRSCKAFLAGCLIILGSTTGFAVSLLFLVAEQVQEREQAHDVILDTLKRGDIELVNITEAARGSNEYSVVSIQEDQTRVRDCFLFKQGAEEGIFHCPMSWDWSLEPKKFVLVSAEPDENVTSERSSGP